MRQMALNFSQQKPAISEENSLDKIYELKNFQQALRLSKGDMSIKVLHAKMEAVVEEWKEKGLLPKDKKCISLRHLATMLNENNGGDQQRHYPPDEIWVFQEATGNMIPLQYLNLKSGCTLQRIKQAYEIELEEKNKEIEELNNKLRHMEEFIKIKG